jgi:hypothetical protein
MIMKYHIHILGIVLASAIASSCQTHSVPSDPTGWATVHLVAYHGMEGRGEGEWYWLASSHELILNPHFGTHSIVTTNGSEFLVVNLSATYKAAAQAFMDAAPDYISTYVMKIEGHNPKHLDRRSNPLKVERIYIPLKKKETSNK